MYCYANSKINFIFHYHFFNSYVLSIDKNVLSGIGTTVLEEMYFFACAIVLVSLGVFS